LYTRTNKISCFYLTEGFAPSIRAQLTIPEWNFLHFRAQ